MGSLIKVGAEQHNKVRQSIGSTTKKPAPQRAAVHRSSVGAGEQPVVSGGWKPVRVGSFE